MKKHRINYMSLLTKSKSELIYDQRRELVEEYLQVRSYRKAAREHGVNVKTVIKWVKRYKEDGLEGLRDRSRRPHRSCRKVTRDLEQKILTWRDRTGFGAMRMRMELGFDLTATTIHKVLKRNGKVKPRRKLWRKKRDLRKIKHKLRPLDKLQMDIKYLDDIPELYPDYVKHKLPRYEITIRDVRSGGVWLFYSHERSVWATCMAADIFAAHLKKHGIRLSQVQVQTDNGAEFSGTRMHHHRGFRYHVTRVLGMKHRFIPPRCANANADVETFHRLVEDEFYTRERFGSMKEFLSKAFTYQLYFNLVRKNSYKAWKSPADILTDYGLIPRVLIMPPILLKPDLNLDKSQNQPNLFPSSLYHHVCVYPGKRSIPNLLSGRRRIPFFYSGFLICFELGGYL
jgi:transposase